MRIVAVKQLLAICMLAPLLGCSMRTVAAGDGINIDALRQPLHVSDVKKTCSKLSNGHGPYLWCTIPGSDKEIWFWFIPRENVGVDEYEVVFITEGKNDDSDTQGVVWPEEMKDKPLDQIYRSVYKNLISK